MLKIPIKNTLYNLFIREYTLNIIRSYLMTKKSKIVVVITIIFILVLGIAYYLFATSGITESDVQNANLPFCDTPEASSSLGCVER
jgi:hypothetical protein